MHIRYILLTCLLFVGVSMAAQQKKTEKATITNPSGVGAELPYALEYDYTLVDSSKVANGIFKISGQNKSEEFKEAYNLKTQASNGLLNGTLTAEYSLEGLVKGSKRYLEFSYSGAFQNGLPHGDTKIKSFGQGSSVYDVKMSFNKGVLQGKFKFNAFVKREIDIEGTFNSEGQMTGSWKFGQYNVLAEEADRNTVVFSNGLKLSGAGYTKVLEDEAQKLSEGKTTEAELRKKGIIIKSNAGNDIEEIVLGAIRNRFIPFDSLPSTDFSKVNFSYKYLDYFPAVNEEGFNLLIAELDNYDGYTLPTFATFGIFTNGEGNPSHKYYEKELESYIHNSEWDENQKCEVLFTEEQAVLLQKHLESTQENWKKGAIAICRSNYEILIGQQLLGKSSAEISTLMKNAIKRGYKVEADHGAKRYESYSPIVGFEGGELTPVDDSTALHKYTGIINIGHTDSIGFKTYEWTIFVRNTDPIYICDDLNNSFTPSNFRRVRNDYDTINELMSEIKKNNQDFETLAKNTLNNPFANYSEHISKVTEIDHSDLAGSIEQLTFVIKFQQEFKEWLVKSAEIKTADNQIKGSKNKFAKVKDSYEEYLKNADLSWSPNNDLEGLIKLEDVQHDILSFIEGSSRLAENHKQIRANGSKYKELLNQYKKFIKHTDINWSDNTDLKQLDSLLNIQDKTLEFISKRDQIAINHASIIDGCENKYSKVEKAYNKYFRKVDLSWTPEVCQAKLDTVIDIQNKTVQFVALRDTIVANHHTILKDSRVYRHIRNAYEEYIDNADVSWTQDVDIKKLENIIAIQDSCIATLKQDNVKQINKSARKNKITSITDIVR